MKILFLHGLESGPLGSKYQALKAIFNDVVAPDCSGILHEDERLKIICDAIDKTTEPYLVVGSSMGGLMAMLLQQYRPQRVAGIILCAPALNRPAAKQLTYLDLPPLTAIHGEQDDLIPHTVSQRFGNNLITVQDGHRLTNSVPIILKAVYDMQMKLAGLE